MTEITVDAIRSAMRSLRSCKPKYPEKFYGEVFTPHGVVVISGRNGVSGSPEAIAWMKKGELYR